MATNDNVTLTAGAALEAVLPRIPLLTGMRRLFYVISPAETSHGKLEEVPDYVNEVNRPSCYCHWDGLSK